MTRKYLLIMFALATALLFGMCGCSGGIDAKPSPSPARSEVLNAPSPTQSSTSDLTEETPDSSLSAGASVTQVAAYYFPNVQGSANLYAAIEFKNDSSSHAIVSNVSVSFTVDGKRIEQTFMPPCAEDDVVAPGAVSTVAAWFSYSGDAPTEAVSAAAVVSLETVTPPSLPPMEVSNLMIVQNYPGFATVSGRVTNVSEDADYDLTMTYLSFYNGEGALLGAQFFTKDQMVMAGDSRDFVYHLRCLPVEGLTENTANIIARSVAIN